MNTHAIPYIKALIAAANELLASSIHGKGVRTQRVEDTVLDSVSAGALDDFFISSSLRKITFGGKSVSRRVFQACMIKHLGKGWKKVLLSMYYAIVREYGHFQLKDGVLSFHWKSRIRVPQKVDNVGVLIAVIRDVIRSLIHNAKKYGFVSYSWEDAQNKIVNELLEGQNKTSYRHGIKTRIDKEYDYGLSVEERRDLLSVVRRDIGAFPGASSQRLIKAAYALYVNNTSLEPMLSFDAMYTLHDQQNKIRALQNAGISSEVIAGKYWKALDQEATSPAHYVKRILDRIGSANRVPSANPEVQVIRVLNNINEDAYDISIKDAVLALPGAPSLMQVRQAINRVKKERKEKERAEMLANTTHVATWLNAHDGAPEYQHPKGWKWLTKADASWLIEWASRNGACVIYRILNDSDMASYVGLLRGPEDQVVGIAYTHATRALECPSAHACCDRNNRRDTDAWDWASNPQKATKSTISKINTLIGRAIEEQEKVAERAVEQTNPPRPGPLRRIVRMPSGARVLWVS